MGNARSILRWVHIACAAFVGAYLYSPWSQNALFAGIVLYGVFPLMGLSGLAMWQMVRLKRRLS